MRPCPVLILAGTLFAAARLGAQHAAPQPRVSMAVAAPDSLVLGAPLRLRVHRGPGSPFSPDAPAVRLGTFAGWRADTLLVRFRPHGAPLAIPPGVVHSLERGVGRRPSLGGAVAGSVVGLAVGFLGGALVNALDRRPCGEAPCGAVAPVLGGAAGIVLGAGYGYERGTPRWVPVRLR